MWVTLLNKLYRIQVFNSVTVKSREGRVYGDGKRFDFGGDHTMQYTDYV